MTQGKVSGKFHMEAPDRWISVRKDLPLPEAHTPEQKSGEGSESGAEEGGGGSGSKANSHANAFI